MSKKTILKGSNMKIAVTAASGKLGKAVVNQLKSLISPNDIVGLARTPENAKELGIEVREGDYNDKSLLLKSFEGIDSVLLVSGMDAPDKRIEQHRNVISAAIESGVSKIVYTSIFGEVSNTSFSPIIASNRQTEKDIMASKLNWVIGRNGLYIEPDIEYIENYAKEGKITNCASDGKCSYTTREELGYAYAKLLIEEKHNGNIYNLCGESITQHQLTSYLNYAFNTNLSYESLSIEEYTKQRQAELGEFLGKVIAGIYEGIRNGSCNIKSDYKLAAGRNHISWEDYFSSLKKINLGNDK